ncbi:MAG: DUF1599 domain-containing protein [Bacteroidota bacterium]|uniref:DUF1599 domain-containing protein n=1 Tax=Candidatus Pollutiaquabacter sp. TaxID=3416354 RepID=UPI001A4CD20B|nr:DUF1599 domain-containing protein [Bacteroidota bacterium]MBL7948235.1 DUF1599 domain-containing protein [Bacteroidia bacterium]HPD52648.1 DUF1599 domain-containing protein [Bacteroidia bacterium]HRI41738.1 DUF1599 domain-containing protein [Bacteroidia bacterium]HRS37857.1 DUF1599 domain-containing protein [Bacteroidia bacterium]
MTETSRQYDAVVARCKDIFLKKMKDYGTAWRILRVPSITDQIFIKAQRIRSIEEKGTQRVDDGIDQEFIGIINYAVIALIQLELGVNDETNMLEQDVVKRFDEQVRTAKRLMEDKNHDYGEAWRGMRTSSMTDLILMKLLRIKQIEDNRGQTLISEGIAANYHDIINYAVFAMIKLAEPA